MQVSENPPAATTVPAKPTQTPPQPVPLQPTPPNQQQRPTRKLGPYEFSLDQRIGSGATGDVYVGINTDTYELVCIKVVERAGRSEREKALLENEIRCQQKCNSDFTVRLLDTFDTSSFTFIVSDFCDGGDLYRLVKSSPDGLPEQVVSSMGQELAQAMLSLKKKGIVHRDIKSENVLLRKGTVKLGDFGFAIEEGYFSVKLSKITEEGKFNLGSPLYMSLEALEHSTYSFASDVFSYGVVLYEMLHRECPWQCEDETQLINRIKNEAPQFKNSVSNELKQHITKCLSKEARARPTIQQIVEYWTTQEQMPVTEPVLAEKSSESTEA